MNAMTVPAGGLRRRPHPDAVANPPGLDAMLSLVRAMLTGLDLLQRPAGANRASASRGAS
jgi:hypothetical protein